MGEVFAGRYELIDPIGRGGVGAVWRAWDQRRRRYVAAKVLQQSDAHTLLRFVREQALRIDHPHVLAPASWAADDDKVLFTMELVRGGSLAHLIGDYGPLPPRFVCTLLDQLLAGLTAVHAEGVVHRDIKPANILLEATGTGRPHLRLSDFGISMRKGEPRLTDTNYVVGTPGYFAPEQMLGAEPDFTADLYAVGLVSVFLLTGTKPDSQALVERFTSHGVPNAPEGVPEPLWQVLAGLLQPDPQARFRTATGARKALTAAIEMLPDTTLEEEAVEVFDHIGPLPAGFGPEGPASGKPAGGATPAEASASMSATGSFPLAPPAQPAPQSVAPQSVAPQSVAPQSVVPQHTAPQSTAPQPPGPLPEQPGTPPTPDPVPSGGPYSPASAHAPAPAHPPAAHSPAPSPPHVPTQAHPAVPAQPPATPTAPVPRPQHPATPSPMAAPDSSGASVSGVLAQHTPTRPYTAGSPQVPAPPPASSATPPALAPQRRPGPPPKVAVPVLALALLCFAVGIWALATS
ncbi:protein kinase domain-containing protein [Streptomyces sp. bgisy100]|uniref:serine/threonine-protein kinase n=1 Tax=Streptomyces sp. bgisy100 TaxID=3413783 RepID=UPI003D75B5AF